MLAALPRAAPSSCLVQPPSPTSPHCFWLPAVGFPLTLATCVFRRPTYKLRRHIEHALLPFSLSPCVLPAAFCPTCAVLTIFQACSG
jgi:hypothetical protein